MAKFHGMKHYPHLIRKFGSPLNFFGGYLESFSKDKLKRPSKCINGKLHRLKHDILTRSYQTRQFSLARKIVLASDTLHTENVPGQTTIFRCHPKWNKDSNPGISGRECFDWVEVNWEKGDWSSSYAVQLRQNYFFGKMLFSPTQQPFS